MISIDQLEAAIAQLELIRRAIVRMRPDKHQATILDRVYRALELAERELAELCGTEADALD